LRPVGVAFKDSRGIDMHTLFLHPVVSGRHIADLKRAFAEALELYVLSAYLRSWDTRLKINNHCRD
jgi:hypothetical protein